MSNMPLILTLSGVPPRSRPSGSINVLACAVNKLATRPANSNGNEPQQTQPHASPPKQRIIDWFPGGQKEPLPQTKDAVFGRKLQACPGRAGRIRSLARLYLAQYEAALAGSLPAILRPRKMSVSALYLSLLIFILIICGIFLGALLRKMLPEHHLSKDAQDVVRLGTGLVATMSALVLGLLIASAKGTFDTQSSQVKQITANLILLDNLLAQYGPDARPIRKGMRDAIGGFADKIWREKQARTKQPFEANAASEQIYVAIQSLQPKTDLQKSLQARAVQTSTELAQTRMLLVCRLRRPDSDAVPCHSSVLARASFS